ncbi:methylamine utilization protein MauJ [Streptomyces sp. NPDC058128]|uniref:methylamine utilization protein MauJ n=1 Tax=Streptomyces sp. NPDC058128 TaxID=3346352 RepID=UPI0036F1345D
MITHDDWARLSHAIVAPGLRTNEFKADGRWGMTRVPHSNSIVALPLSPQGFYDRSLETPSWEETLFLADCICYDHDSPTLVAPLGEGPPAPYEPIGLQRSWMPAEQQYQRTLEDVAGHAHEVRYSDSLCLRYSDEGAEDPLTWFSRRFSGRSEALALYAMAVRQVDLLSEYIGLYRVLETPDKDNGKAFITRCLDYVGSHDFGRLMTWPQSMEPAEPIEVFGVLRERALGRIEALRTADIDVAAHLYSIRNGLAHGKKDLILNDFGTTVDAVAADLPLVKLLARLAIELP